MQALDVVRSLAFGVVLAGVMLAQPVAKEPSGLAAVLARAGDYVARFERDLATIVTEEEYTQSVTGKTPLRRELRSDLLLLHPIGLNRYVQFRDVFEVDGQQVRQRDERLLKLAGQPSALSTNQIVAESARYNIGQIERTINVPVLPLMFLLPAHQWRFKFSVKRDARDPGLSNDLPQSPRFRVSTEVWVVDYREAERPTLIRSIDRRKDVAAHGRFWIEPQSGRVLMSELVAEDRSVHSRINVSYQSEPVLGFLVPVEMHETYWRSRDSTRIEGTATYGDFRRLDVK